jgi:hypothetical protein
VGGSDVAAGGWGWGEAVVGKREAAGAVVRGVRARACACVRAGRCTIETRKAHDARALPRRRARGARVSCSAPGCMRMCARQPWPLDCGLHATASEVVALCGVNGG